MRFKVIFNRSNAQKTNKSTILDRNIIQFRSLKSVIETSGPWPGFYPVLVETDQSFAASDREGKELRAVVENTSERYCPYPYRLESVQITSNSVHEALRQSYCPFWSVETAVLDHCALQTDLTVCIADRETVG